jgi:hypothetical protein
MEPIDRDDRLDRALKALEAPRAPRTLLPRVMAAVAEREQQTRVTRPWMQWPRSWRVASFAGMAAVTIAVIWLLPNLDIVMRAGGGWLSQRDPALGGGVESAASFLSVGRTLWETLVGPVLWYVVVWMVVMTTACAALGAALDLALGGASE